MTGHSVLAPSSSARRIQCPASTLLEPAHALPDVDDSEARNGTAAHWGASEQLAGRLIDVGQIAPNGVYLTDEMVQGADLYCDDVTKALGPLRFKPSDGKIEEPVAIPRVHPQSWGTPDYSIWAPAVKTLLVWDYKFGHRVVDPFENRQMVEYVAGLLPTDLDDRHVRVVVSIVQPRSFHPEGPVRRWTFWASEIRGHINQANGAAHEALGANPRARVGPECRDCKARHVCTTLQRDGYRTVDEAERPQPFEMPPGALGLELTTLNAAALRLAARISGLEEQARAAIRRGVSVPGWAVQHGEGREAWTVPAGQVLAVAGALGLNIAKPVEVITPRQAREAGLDPALVAAMSARPSGAAALVPADTSAARKVFG